MTVYVFFGAFFGHMLRHDHHLDSGSGIRFKDKGLIVKGWA